MGLFHLWTYASKQTDLQWSQKQFGTKISFRYYIKTSNWDPTLDSQTTETWHVIYVENQNYMTKMFPDEFLVDADYRSEFIHSTTKSIYQHNDQSILQITKLMTPISKSTVQTQMRCRLPNTKIVKGKKYQK